MRVLLLSAHVTGDETPKHNINIGTTNTPYYSHHNHIIHMKNRLCVTS